MKRSINSKAFHTGGRRGASSLINEPNGDVIAAQAGIPISTAHDYENKNVLTHYFPLASISLLKNPRHLRPLDLPFILVDRYFLKQMRNFI
jgi:hypothetical protein